MRLVDADKLQIDEYKYIHRHTIITAPTVKAIPIECLEQYRIPLRTPIIDQVHGYGSGDPHPNEFDIELAIDNMYRKGWNDCLDRLSQDWRKENE